MISANPQRLMPEQADFLQSATPQGCFLQGAVDQRFWAIFMLSLALHAAALLWMQTGRHQAPVVLPSILASLRLIAAPVAAPPAEPHAAPAPAAAARPAKQQPPRREQLAMHAAAAIPAPPVTASPAATEQPNYPAPAAVAAVSPAPATPQVAGALAKMQGSLLDAYRQRLTEILARQQEYPRVAALRGWEGEVRLRLRVARKGNLLAVQLDHSSGFDVLDQHALAMLEALAGLPPLPEALDSNEIQVVVPISYKLKKTT